MKLLHIIASMDPSHGGPCQGIRNTNPELMRYGISREVVSLDAPDSSFLGMDDFEIHALGPPKGPWQYSPKLKPWLLANMHRFDVVVINGLWLYSSYAGWSAKRALERRRRSANSLQPLPRLYVMPHGMLDPYFQRAAERRLKAIRNWVYWQFIEKRVVNDADGLFFTCQTELELAREAFPDYRPKQEINVGYGIVAPPEYSPQMQLAFYEKCPKTAGRPFLLFFSRIHPKKGVDLLIEAFAAVINNALKDNLPALNLIIAGPGLDSAYGSRLLRITARYPQLRDKVFFPGMLTGDAKWGAIYTSEAFVLPSHQENFGIAVVEALACKKPVLVSSQVNIWKEIVDGGGGIVEPDDFNGTQNLLKKWLRLSVPDRQTMGLNAYQVFAQNFDVTQVAKHFIKAIFNG